MDTPNETNMVALPPVSPFGAAYRRHLQTTQDPAEGVAQAKQERMDKEQGPDWGNPELVRVPENPILTRPATHAENDEFAEHTAGLLAVATGGGVLGLLSGGAKIVAGGLLGGAAIAWNTHGADYLGKIGRTGPDAKARKHVYGVSPNPEELPVQDRPENMMEELYVGSGLVGQSQSRLKASSCEETAKWCFPQDQYM